MAGTELEQEGSPITVGHPGERSVDARFREDQTISGIRFRVDDIVRDPLEISDVIGQVCRGEIGFVRAGYASESAGAFGTWGEEIHDDDEAIEHDAIAEMIRVRRLPFVAVESTLFGPLSHENAVVLIRSKFRAD